MAPVSSSFSSSFSSSSRWPYDLFLSYTGSDSNNFRGHLIHNLEQKGLIIFNDKEHRRGEYLPSALDVAIECSRASIVVFSEEYAKSRWCLDELVKILDSKKLYGQMVRPIFYKVDPSVVRNQRGSYGEAMAAHENRFKHDLEKVQCWRRALTEAANLTGWTFTDGGDEPKFIQKVVEEVSRELAIREHLNVAEYPVGLKHRVRELNSILHIGNNENDAQLVVVYGPQGIGKTTLAKAVYNSNVLCFKGSSFLADVSENSRHPLGLVQLQTTLLSETLRESNIVVGNVDRGITLIKKRLRNKKVLLVLDDVGSLNSLHYLAKNYNWFGKGSIIIVTTRDVNMINSLAFPYISFYEVKSLDYDAARKLFHWNTFPNEIIQDDFLPLTELALECAQGHPSRLIELGTSLHGKNKDEWIIELKQYRRNFSRDLNSDNVFKKFSLFTKRFIFRPNSQPDLRSSDVAKLNQPYSINIKGESLKEKLDRGMIYKLYFVFKFLTPVSAFKAGDIQLIVNPGVSEGGQQDAAFLNPPVVADIFYERGENGCMAICIGEFSTEEQQDGCTKFIKGRFFNNNENDCQIMFHLVELQISVKKTDIIVQRFEFWSEYDDLDDVVLQGYKADMVPHLSLNLDGKAYFMLSWRKLSIRWTENFPCWKLTSVKVLSRNYRVMKLNIIHDFNIEGSIESRLLSSETTYLICFVFTYDGCVSGFKERPVKFTITFEKANYFIERYAFLDPELEDQRLCCERKDGWIELKMGEVFIDGDHGVISFCLTENDQYVVKAGLVVRGVEFRPKFFNEGIQAKMKDNKPENTPNII